MPYTSNGGVRLHWEVRGEGPPILLIMGHKLSSAMWYAAVEGLGDRYRLITFDNQGSGKSGARSRTSIAEMTADAIAVLDAAGVETAHVYGVSMGGGIALELGARYPHRVRSLILGCTMAKTPDIARRPKWLISLAYRILPLLKMFAKPAKFNNGYGDNAPADAIARDQATGARDAWSMKGVVAQGQAISDYSITPEEVAGVTLPALVLHGKQDLAVPYEAGKRLSELLPDARLVTFEGIGHNYFIGAADRANAEVDRFIRAVENAG
ncbi:MAG: alpha/beta hydrolase [Pseudomonadota bacterium]